jgi:hypothetical protein
MKHHITFIIVLAFTLVGCANYQRIAVNPNSEMGQAMADMDAAALIYHNEFTIKRSLKEFEGETGYSDIESITLVEPGELISKKVVKYTIKAESRKHGSLTYQANVHFKDRARTTIRKVDSIQKLK